MLTSQERNNSNRKTDQDVTPFFEEGNNLLGLDRNVAPDIVRLLDILARIEMRRQTKQRLVDKEKAS